MTRKTVLITDVDWPDIRIEEEILGRAGIDVRLAGGTDNETLAREGADCDALMVLFTPMPAETLAIFPRCKALVRLGIGYNSVDMDAATRLGIRVCNIPDYCQEEVADHTVAMFLAGVRKICLLDSQVKAGGWNMHAAGSVPRLRGKVFGLWGCGGIGRLTGKRLLAFGLRVAAFDPYLSPEALREEGFLPCADVNELLAQSDFLSLHMPLTPETRHAVNAETLRAMKRGVYIVNASRGGLVDEEALLEAIRSGQASGAALDVLGVEPPAEIPPLATLPSVTLTPHAAWNSDDAIPELRTKAAQNLVRFFETGELRHWLNPRAAAAV